MSEFKRSDVQKIAAEILLAVAAIEKKHNIVIERGNSSYDDDSFSLKLNVKKVAANGRVDHFKKEAEAFHMYSNYRHNIKVADLHRPFSLNGEKFVVVGYRPRASKKPVVIQKVSEFKENSSNAYGVGVEAVVNNLSLSKARVIKV